MIVEPARIVSMPPHLEPDVRELFALCHPDHAPLPEPWFFAHPTLIAIHDGAVVGYASYSMNVSDTGELSIWLRDTGITPHMRGAGLAKRLMQARLDIGRAMSARLAVGATQPDNTPMLAILKSFGFEQHSSHVFLLPL